MNYVVLLSMVALSQQYRVRVRVLTHADRYTASEQKQGTSLGYHSERTEHRVSEFANAKFENTEFANANARVRERYAVFTEFANAPFAEYEFANAEFANAPFAEYEFANAEFANAAITENIVMKFIDL